MSRPAWFVSVLKRSFGARFGLAKLTRAPVAARLVERALFDGDHMVYLPKDNVVQVHAAIEMPDNFVLPSQILERFIQEANYHWIMNFCICRASAGCQDYPIELGCLFLGEAVLDINPSLGRRVTRAEALAHVARCRDAGLVHMIGRNKLDTVWLGIGPGQKLMTICHCCPCCCLWKMIPDLDASLAAKVKRMPGVTVGVTDRCEGCGTCASDGVCFVKAIEMHEGHARIGQACRGCGRCVEACPAGAIELWMDDARRIEETTSQLARLVDIS